MPNFDSHSTGRSIAHGETISRSDGYSTMSCGCSNPPCGSCTYGAQQRVRDALRVLLNALVDSGDLPPLSANGWTLNERRQLLLVLLLSDLM
jgi:hypothetical protein